MLFNNPPHPGKVLRDGVFTDADTSVSSFARRLGISRVALHRVLAGKAAISPDMALRLADALGGSAESWLHMQADYDLWQARQKPRPTVERLPSQH